MNDLQLVELNDIETRDETFQIHDINRLNWAFRKISVLRLKEKEIKSLADAERERIQDWEDRELGKLTDDISYFERLVQDYHFRTLLQDPKAKTLSTPYGKSKSRQSKPQPEKVDEEKLLNYVLSNDMQDYVKKSLNWGEFKKTLKVVEVNGESIVTNENGEAIEGVIVKPESINFNVEVE